MEHKLQERSGWTLWASYIAVAWCVLFGVLHLYWALGGNAGLAEWSTPPNKELALARAPLYIGMTWGVSIVCLVGAVATLATIQTWGRRIPRWMPLTILWIACGLCFVRGLGNPIQSLLIITGLFPFGDLDGPLATAWYRWLVLDATLFSPYFTLGGIVFGATA